MTKIEITDEMVVGQGQQMIVYTYTGNWGTTELIVDDDGLKSVSEFEKYLKEHYACEYLPISPELDAWMKVSSSVLERKGWRAGT